MPANHDDECVCSFAVEQCDPFFIRNELNSSNALNTNHTHLKINCSHSNNCEKYN